MGRLEICECLLCLVQSLVGGFDAQGAFVDDGVDHVLIALDAVGNDNRGGLLQRLRDIRYQGLLEKFGLFGEVVSAGEVAQRGAQEILYFVAGSIFDELIRTFGILRALGDLQDETAAVCGMAGALFELRQ